MTLLLRFGSLIGSMAPIWGYALYYVLALAFVATVPVVIRDLFRR